MSAVAEKVQPRGEEGTEKGSPPGGEQMSHTDIVPGVRSDPKPLTAAVIRVVTATLPSAPHTQRGGTHGSNGLGGGVMDCRTCLS